jgi:hypothetical protein
MKKLLALVLVLPLLTAAAPEVVDDAFIVEKRVICDKTNTMFQVLMNGQSQENPIWGGTNGSAKFSLFTNKETGTWTMVQFNKDVACILGHGDNSFSVTRGKIL